MMTLQEYKKNQCQKSIYNILNVLFNLKTKKWKMIEKKKNKSDWLNWSAAHYITIKPVPEIWNLFLFLTQNNNNHI
jgi:hypothetical protein